MYKIFPKLSHAITYARSISDEDNDEGIRYLTNHQGEHYDSKEKRYFYGRIAVDSVSTYFEKPDHNVNNIRPGTIMYLLYDYHDYKDDGSVAVHIAFDVK